MLNTSLATALFLDRTFVAEVVAQLRIQRWLRSGTSVLTLHWLLGTIIKPKFEVFCLLCIC